MKHQKKRSNAPQPTATKRDAPTSPASPDDDMTPTARHLLLTRLDDWQRSIREALATTRCWDVLPAAGDTPLAVVEVQQGRRYPPAAELERVLRAHPFLEVVDGQERRLVTLHTQTQLLWHRASEIDDGQLLHASEARKRLSALNWLALSGWRLPSKAELWNFASAEANPYRGSSKYRLQVAPGGYAAMWLTHQGCCDTDDGAWGVDARRPGRVYACQAAWVGASPQSLLEALAERGLSLRLPQGDVVFGYKPFPNTLDSILATLARQGERLRAGGREIAPGAHPALAMLADIDYRPSRLPKLELAQIADPHKGLWEAWGAPPEALAEWGIVARDPSQDLQTATVGIDFGTSSTVVAIDDGQQPRLLRVGARDFYAPEEPQHFENPTVLECLDFAAFWQAWTAKAYRPDHDWDWMRVGHEAQAEWRNNPGKTEVLAAILPRMKQWALRGDAPPLRLYDRKSRTAVTIPPLRDRTPLRGQPLVVSPDDPFDPIEFYAFQLGMVINWRNRGIFTRYYLSFPVKYDRQIKQRILASFARGLQRSLPPTLIEQGRVLNAFTVEELASEPAAYAAAALRHLKLEPSPGGLAYAVFDFGGGTTDFDFGRWRWATPEEEEAGYEEVFEHLHSSGDNFLGGENLLEHLAFRVLCDNLDALRGKRIHFTKPLDALAPPQAEAFIQPTEAAQTNVVMLMTRLRPFMESEDGANLKSQINVELLDAERQKQPVDLGLDPEALDKFLYDRIAQGVRLFLCELAAAFREPVDGSIHILLAGNGSRSRHVRALFDSASEPWSNLVAEAFPNGAPDLVIHPPLPLDPAHPHAPTAKTGVALGLLRLAPGRGVKVINHVLDRQAGEAPFRYFVGRLRRGRFEPALTPRTPYREWQELGPIAQGVFNLYISASLRAYHGLSEGDAELGRHSLICAEAKDGDRLWARVMAPNRLEYCTLPPGQRPDASTRTQTLTLA